MEEAIPPEQILYLFHESIRSPEEMERLRVFLGFETLEAELRRAGFTEVHRRELNESPVPHLAGLDLRAAEGGAQMAVEAVR